jgi:ribosomal protein S18 acetylase RimI-like enzyme
MSDTDRIVLLQPTAEHVESLVKFVREEYHRVWSYLFEPGVLEAYLEISQGHVFYHDVITHNGEKSFVHIAVDSTTNEIVGFILCGENSLPIVEELYPHDNTDLTKKNGELKKLYIRPHLFGKGIAEKLTDVALAWFKSKGYEDRIFLSVFSENFRAQKFYARKGFQKIGEYFFPIGDNIFMYMMKLEG